MLHSLVMDGVFNGVGSVLSFLPIIVTLFFFLSLLEDSGYMARVAFVMDKLLRKIGLSGRSIVPMFVMMIVWCGVRVTYISIVIRIIPVINVIYWAYPLTWFISSVIFLILFLKTDWIHGLEKQ